MKKSNAIERRKRVLSTAARAVEVLENRVLMSATPPGGVVANGVLTVTGTTGADVISVNFTSDQTAAGLTGTFSVTVNGVNQSFNASGVGRLAVNSLDGNDSVTVYEVQHFDAGATATPTPIDTSINVGNGNDTVMSTVVDADYSHLATQATTVVNAGSGNDSLTAEGGGLISIFAGSGNDTLESGQYDDKQTVYLSAGGGNDTFIGGGTLNNTATIMVGAGGGSDTYENTDIDNFMTATANNGPTFTVDNQTVAITGTAYIDNSGGSSATANQLPAGSTVYLDDNNNGLLDTGEPSATTDQYGSYVLSNLDATAFGGDGYTSHLRIVPTAGYTASDQSVAINRGTSLSGINPYLSPIIAGSTGKLSGTLIATAGSYQNDGNTAANAIDGNLNTYFDAPTANGNYVGLDLGSATAIKSISFAPRSGWAQRMVGGIFQGSNSANFASPVTLYTVAAAPVVGSLTTVAVSNTTAFRYVRYLAPAGSYGNIAEMQFFGQLPRPAVYANGVLTVTGTSGGDNITVQLLDVENQPQGITLTTAVDGTVQSFSIPTLYSIVINTGSGDDTVGIPSTGDFALTNSLAVSISMGDGNDTVTSKIQNPDGFSVTPITTNETIVAGNGNDSFDVLSGGTANVRVGNGNDTIEFDAFGNGGIRATVTAGNGNDLFHAAGGGYNAVTVTAGTGHDTLFDDDPDNTLSGTFGGIPITALNTAGEPATGVAGRVYIDKNGDGIYDTGDTPVAGAQVFVDVNDNTVYDTGEATAFTDANGFYFIADITNDADYFPTGPAAIHVVSPAGYESAFVTTSLPGGVVTTPINFTVAPAPKLTGTLLATAGSYQNDGNTAARAIDGNTTTFFDGPTANGNDVGLDLGSAKTITAIGYAPRSGYTSRMVGGIFQGSNSADFSSPVTLYTISTAPVAGGLTTVSVTNPAGFRYVRYLSPAGSYGNIAEVQFFGVPQLTGAITAHLFNDTNGNQTQDTGEANLSGFGVYLDLNNDGVFDGSDIRGIADANGNVTFSNLPVGTYSLRQTVPVGYYVTVGLPATIAVNPYFTQTVSIGDAYIGVHPLYNLPEIGTAGSYHNDGYTLKNAFDQNFSTYFDGPDASGDWVGVDMGTARAATQVQFAPRADIASRLKGGQFQASNTADFSSGVVTLATITSTPAAGVLTTLSLNNTTAYRYYRYIGPANSYCDIAELQFEG